MAQRQDLFSDGIVTSERASNKPRLDTFCATEQENLAKYKNKICL